MLDLNAVVDEALVDPLKAARTHRDAGGRVVGFVGPDVPVELILAAGSFPLQLPATAQGTGSIGDAYFEPSFAPAVRSIAEQWLAGAFDFIDAVVLARTDDSAQRLFYYMSELHRLGRISGPKPLLYDLAKIQRDTSAQHSLAATRTLADTLGVNEDALCHAIDKRNRRRRLFAEADRARRSDAPPRGSTIARILRAADTADAEPPLEPPGSWSVAQGFRTGPKKGLMLVLP